MKKILALALAMLMVFALAACGGKTDPAPSGGSTTDPGTSQQQEQSEQPSSTPDPGTSEPSSTTEPDTSQPSTHGEVFDFTVALDGIPAEWQKGIGTEMFGFEANGDAEYSAGYAQKFGNVTQEDFDKLVAYFDTLTYSEKQDTAYFTDFGRVQALFNEKFQEITITWWLSK